MFTICLFFGLYFFIMTRIKSTTFQDTKPTSDYNFVFGTTDMLQIIKNYNLLHGIFKIDWRIKLRTDGFFEVYENNICKGIIRKPFRRAKRCVRILEDTQDTRKELLCRVCTVNKMCVMYEPCGHLGVCNECSFKLLNLAFYKKSKCKAFPHRMFPDPRYTHNDNMDDILYDIQLSKNECPFCKTYVDDIKYVYIP